MHIAAFEGDLDEIRRLVTLEAVPVDAIARTIAGASVSQTPLFLAIQEGHLEAAKLLLNLGSNVDVVDENGCTALMRASSGGELKLVELLLAFGADPNFTRPSDDATPLSFATHLDEKDSVAAEVTQALIEAGAVVDQPAEQSVLMEAARANLPAVLQVLLRAGADPERRCSLHWAMGWTALDHAINERRRKAISVLRPVTSTRPIAKAGMV